MPREPDGPRDVILRPKDREDFHGKDFYQILGLRKEDNPTITDIRKAYRRRAIELHPDKHQENQEYYTELFKQLVEAYDVLSNELRRALYDTDMSDIFAAVAKKAAYYHAATQERLNREYYRANILWLIGIYRKEREELKSAIFSKARQFAFELENKFPGYFGTGYGRQMDRWISDQINWGQLAYPDKKTEPVDYPKGEKTPEQLMAQELEELGEGYRWGLEICKSNLRVRVKHYAQTFNQTEVKDRVYTTDAKDYEYRKEFKLGNLLIVRKNKSYHINVKGQELPEAWDELIWQENGIIFGKRAEKFVLISPDTGLPLSQVYDDLEIKEGLLVATVGSKKCILNNNDGKEITRQYDALVVFDNTQAQGVVFGEGEYFLEIKGGEITETES